MNVSAIYGIMILVVGLVLWRRTRAMYRPIQGSGIKILIPVLFLLPAISMFSELPLQLNLWEIGAASLTGIVLSIPLVLTSNFEIREDGKIYAQKNKTFVIALIAIVAIRIVARQYFSALDPASVAVLFVTVAFSYIVPWRIASFLKFRKVKQSQASGEVMIGSVKRV
ncbi:CcdC family protein [Pseudalkalibacillus caeni]|uniref:Cytochrome c biogenesis protein CcdC n=1 Tax=Exobacillus caeni TaxID=2574798 RepID=A0A5R9EY30_9BACL|nr:cytochrome c biogenesis protein CcdC [Pseudalkalibacillus caeni]TLS36017.1 cytochrome c biogenesis protein CcdC [Pseudalkalibacillus caeni]